MGVSDPFFSEDFAADFFSSGKDDAARPKIAQAMSSHLPEKKPKKRKSGKMPKPIDDAAYRQGRRKKKREPPQRSRSKSPTPTKSVKRTSVKRSSPQPQAQKSMSPKNEQEPSVFYGSQLAQLISMGFNETEKNVNAIVRAKGNVQVAVSIL